MSGSTWIRSILAIIVGLLSLMSVAPAHADASPVKHGTAVVRSFSHDPTPFERSMSYVHAVVYQPQTLMLHPVVAKNVPAPAPKPKPVPKHHNIVSQVTREVVAVAGNLETRAMDIALSEIGKPYVWGSTGPSSFDCSGLVYYAYHHAGYSGITRTTYTQYVQSQKVSQSDARPGDLVFFSSGPASSNGGNVFHVGVYLGHGMMVAAPHSGASVEKESIKYVSNYISFGRI